MRVIGVFVLIFQVQSISIAQTDVRLYEESKNKAEEAAIEVSIWQFVEICQC